MLVSPRITWAQSNADTPTFRRIEVRVETVANREGERPGPCEVVQVKSASSSPSFTFWSTLGEAVSLQSEHTGNHASSTPRSKTSYCGGGPFSEISSSTPGEFPRPPFQIYEVSTLLGWDSGAMDPGPLGAFTVAITITSREQTGFSAQGKPVYGNTVTDRRTTRLEPGEEFVLPVQVDARLRETLRIHEVLVGIRVAWVGREGASEYGSISIKEAAPGSDVYLDGGIAGRASVDGSLLLPSVLVGLREVRIRGMSGSVVSRVLSVVKGRTILVVPVKEDMGAPPQPSLIRAGKNAEGFEEFRRVRDGAMMVQIPEGEFLMGNLQTEGAPLPHTVYVSSFLMDKLPVTVGLFKRFAAATGRPLPPDPYWGVHDNFPVAFVRWDESKAYCEWTGGRLPTEAEREKATRGTDGRLWPWGNQPPPSPDRAVFRRVWGLEGNDAVGIHPTDASPYGLHDTGGNMWEFCEDWWDPDYFKSSPYKDPKGPKISRARVVKGGSWDSRPTVLSASSRNFAYTGYREGDFGFRCAADPPK